MRAARRILGLHAGPSAAQAAGSPRRSAAAGLLAAAGALGRLNGAVGTLPDADLRILMCARKEAVLSSRIEGAQSMLRDRKRPVIPLGD